MNAPERLPLPDIQALPDLRQLAIARVGVKCVRHPLRWSEANGHAQNTVATFDMYVGLPPGQKGTHMSRFLEILALHGREMDRAGFALLFERMLDRLEASTGLVDMRFTCFYEKAAPVSGVASLMDYEVRLRREVRAPGADCESWIEVLVPVTSLCPCSKEISAYGAHNQRSHVTIRVLEAPGAAPLALTEMIGIAEAAASCELYGLLKRPDEKYVTERAYDNPKFVEDLVRDIALALQADARIAAYSVGSENFESIHNHSAYALIRHDKRAAHREVATAVAITHVVNDTIKTV